MGTSKHGRWIGLCLLAAALALPVHARAEADDCATAMGVYRDAQLRFDKALAAYGSCGPGSDATCAQALRQVQTAQGYLTAAGEHLGFSCLETRARR